MKVLLDFLPIALFFGAFKLYDIYIATAVLMTATSLQMAVLYFTEGKLQTLQKITLALILGFGALTLLLHDDRFIKWKPTVLYAGMALALALALWVWKKNYLKLMLGGQISLPDAAWMRLSIAWIAYAAFMSLVNAYVAANFSTEDWVNFKLWGYAFPLVFLVGQGIYIARNLQPEAPPA